MNMVGHKMPFYNLYSFVCTQLFQNISNALFVLIINYFSSILWSEDDMVLTHPLRSVYKELHADHETGAADNK